MTSTCDACNRLSNHVSHAHGMWHGFVFTSVGCEATVLQLLLQPVHLCTEKWIHYLWLYQLLGVGTKAICIIRFQLNSLLFPHIVFRRLWKWLFSAYVTCAKWHLCEQTQTWARLKSPETDRKKKKKVRCNLFIYLWSCQTGLILDINWFLVKLRRSWNTLHWEMSAILQICFPGITAQASVPACYMKRHTTDTLAGWFWRNPWLELDHG